MTQDPSKPTPPRKGSRSTNKITNRLVALSSAAVLTVYSAGYFRTRSAADRFAVEAAERRPAAPPAAPAATATSGVPTVGAITAVPARPVPETGAGDPPKLTTLPRPSPASPAGKKATPASVPADGSAVLPVADPAQTTAQPAAPPATTVPVTAEPPAPPPPQPQYKDGTYSGWGTSRHGDIQASVVIEDGRITSAFIAQCLTRYSCSWISHLPGQVISRQSPDVDFVSGATQSTNAFYYAIVEALSKAK